MERCETERNGPERDRGPSRADKFVGSLKFAKICYEKQIDKLFYHKNVLSSIDNLYVALNICVLYSYFYVIYREFHKILRMFNMLKINTFEYIIYLYQIYQMYRTFLRCHYNSHFAIDTGFVICIKRP